MQQHTHSASPHRTGKKSTDIPSSAGSGALIDVQLWWCQLTVCCWGSERGGEWSEEKHCRLYTKISITCNSSHTDTFLPARQPQIQEKAYVRSKCKRAFGQVLAFTPTLLCMTNWPLFVCYLTNSDVAIFGVKSPGISWKACPRYFKCRQ